MEQNPHRFMNSQQQGRLNQVSSDPQQQSILPFQSTKPSVTDTLAANPSHFKSLPPAAAAMPDPEVRGTSAGSSAAMHGSNQDQDHDHDRHQDFDDQSDQGTPSPFCESHNGSTAARHMQLEGALRLQTSAAAAMHTPAAAAAAPGYAHHSDNQQQQWQQQGAFTGFCGRTGDNARPAANANAAAMHTMQAAAPVSDVPMLSGTVTMSSSAAACSSATAAHGSGHSGLGSSTPAAAAAESAMHLPHQTGLPRMAGFSNAPFNNQGTVDRQCNPPQTMHQGSGWNEGLTTQANNKPYFGRNPGHTTEAPAAASWQPQQQHGQPPFGTAAPAAGSSMDDLSLQYYTLAKQQQMLRDQLNDLQNKERMLLQRQATNTAAAAAAKPAAASEGYDPHMLAAWHSFTSEGPDHDLMTDAPSQLRTRSSPPTVAAAPVIRPAAKQIWQQQPDDPPTQQQQQQQQQREGSPVCMMDSSGGSDSTEEDANKQQVAAVVADLVENVATEAQPAAAAAAAEEQDELTSCGENCHQEDNLAAAAATSMHAMLDDCAAAAATAGSGAAAAVLEPMDSCSPMLPSTRRNQQQQQQQQLNAVPDNSESPDTAAAAAAAGDTIPHSTHDSSKVPAAGVTTGPTLMDGTSGVQQSDLGPRVTPPQAAVQTGPASNNGGCMFDLLDFNDDLPGGILLEDLLEFGSPPRAQAGGLTAAAAEHGSMQQQQCDGTPADGSYMNRRTSWSSPSAATRAFPPQQQQWQQQQQQHWQQQQGSYSYGPGASQLPPQLPGSHAAAAAAGSSMHMGRSSTPGLPPMGPQYSSAQPQHGMTQPQHGTAQPQHRQVPVSGLHLTPSWHNSHPPGRPTVTTGANQSFHHVTSPHVISTYQQQQQQQQQAMHNAPDYNAQQQGRYPGMITGGRSGDSRHCYNGSYDNRVTSMSSCPPDMLSNMGGFPAAAAAHSGSGMLQQQQQPMMMSPRTQSWSGSQRGPAAAAAAAGMMGDCIDAQLECIMSDLHRQPASPAAAAAAGMWQQQSLHRSSSHGMEAQMAPSGYNNPTMLQQSRSVISGEQYLGQQSYHMQQQQQQNMYSQQQMQQQPQGCSGSPFGNARAQNAQFRSLGLSGPMSGPGPEGLRVSGSGHDSLRLSGPHQMLTQHHSCYTAPYPDQTSFQHQQQQQQQQSGYMSHALQKVGSAPVTAHQQYMTSSGPVSFQNNMSQYNSPAGPSSRLNPAPSAPHMGPGFSDSQVLYPQGPNALNPAGYRTAALPPQQQQQQTPMKIKLKVQLQPVKRGRGRPPSRARLAAKEVDIIPIPVRDDSEGPAAAAAASTAAAAASGIKYLDTPRNALSLPMQRYGLYSSSSGPAAGELPGMYGDHGMHAAAAAAAGSSLGYGGDQVLTNYQLQRKRSGQFTGMESSKSAKSIKLESSSSYSSERTNSSSSNSSGGIGSAPKKKSGMPVPIMRNGVLIPPPAGPEMTARGKPTFADLVQAGAFPPGTYEFSVGTVQSVTATVSAGGVITYDNEQYQSISSFALAAARSRNPNRQACDGWKEVRLQGKKLELWRQAFLNKAPPPAIPPACIKTN